MRIYKDGKFRPMNAEEQAEYDARHTPEAIAQRLADLKSEAIKKASLRTLELMQSAYIEPEEGKRLVMGSAENQSRWILLGARPDLLPYPYPTTCYDADGNRSVYMIQDEEHAISLFAMIMQKEAEIKTAEAQLVSEIQAAESAENIPHDNRR